MRTTNDKKNDAAPKLSLNKETLTELRVQSAVQAGSGFATSPKVTCASVYCMK